jgi:hypothetical protein
VSSSVALRSENTTRYKSATICNNYNKFNNAFFQPERMTVCYWKHKNKNSRFNHENYPTFFTRTAADKYTIYGVPEYDYPDLVKVT